MGLYIKRKISIFNMIESLGQTKKVKEKSLDIKRERFFLSLSTPSFFFKKT